MNSRLQKLTTLILTCITTCFFWSCTPTVTEKESVTNTNKEAVDYVDPFIGTSAHGHTFPGPTLPFGMVQLSPDNGTQGWDWCSGYHITDSIIVGFSHLHLSGTGIGDLVDILVMPVNREIDFTKPTKERNDYQYKSSFSHDKEKAKPGYYQVYLDDNKVNAELTASLRSGMHRYTFDDEKQHSFVLDLSFAINWDKPVETQIKVVNDTLIEGYRFSKGWAEDQKTYFTIELSQPIASKVLASNTDVLGDVAEVKGEKAKAQFFFDPAEKQPLLMKVGISSVSSEGAKANMDHDIAGWDFDGVVSTARDTWQKELNKIKVTSNDNEKKTIFYTAMYHSFIAPSLYSDLDGQYKGADGKIHKAEKFDYYSTFSIWDTFRANNPLFTLTQPDKVNDFVNTMLSHYDEYGLLPVWSLQANETNCMTGYHAVPVIADAYFKGYRGFDAKKAYEAMKTSSMQNIRGVQFLKKYGYIPADLEGQSVTKNLEYAYDDWCIAQMAKEFGTEEEYEYYMERANGYKKLFDKETGFMRGKKENGEWTPDFDPKFSSHAEMADYTEGNAWQHSWFVPQDVEGLKQLFGSDERFLSHLDSLFSENSDILGDNKSPDISGLIGQYAHGNEPSHHIAYMYNYAGKPWKSQAQVRQIMDSLYTVEPDGICGNEDCGQMSAWYVLSAMGFYPVNPADGNFVFGSPLFDEAVLQLPDSKTLTITANNVSDDNIYIQKVTFNGTPLEKTFITYEELKKGGTLVYEMGSEPNKNWGTTPSAYPPSMTPLAVK